MRIQRGSTSTRIELVIELVVEGSAHRKLVRVPGASLLALLILEADAGGSLPGVCRRGAGVARAQK